MAMSYEEEKELLPVLKGFVDVAKLNIFQMTFKASRLKKYPELDGPVYYPELRNYTALPKEMIYTWNCLTTTVLHSVRL